jgi:hypothetical protein
MKCGDCKYWKANEDFPGDDFGCCKRNAPPAYVNEISNSKHACWPTTADIDWCGEFQKVLRRKTDASKN